eukprot:502604_1
MSIEHLLVSARGASRALARSISQETGKLLSQKDIGAYAKLATSLQMNGYGREANLTLDYISNNFLHSNGDYKTSNVLKSSNGAYQIYYPYVNQWIIRAALDCDRSELVYGSPLDFVNKYWNPELKGATITNPYNTDENNDENNDDNNSICLFMTAHMGFTSLFTGNIERAIDCADTIISFINEQLDEYNGIYLRKNCEGKLIKNDSLIEFVSNKDSDQLYFFIGYPLWYLSVVYDEFEREKEYEKYLNGANKIGQFVIKCVENETNILESNWSHKVATGLSLLCGLVDDEILRKQYKEFSLSIANNLINHYQNDNGMFEVDVDGIEQENLDQTAEIAMHLKLIHLHLDENA